MVVVGETIKVLLPGETPWVEVIEELGNKFKGQILNKLLHEFSEHEQAQFTKRWLGTVQQLPQLHVFKKGDQVWFEEGTDECDGCWIPVENMN